MNGTAERAASPSDAATPHPFRDPISALPQGEARPRWSVMIPTYHCARHLADTLSSVLAQDPGADAMQIEVVDDASTNDDPRAVVEALGRGRVGFYRQDRNVGHTRNFTTCLRRARGELVHLLHGDDCVRPGFYQAMERGFTQRPDVGAAFCRQIFMNEIGEWTDISAPEPAEGGVLSDGVVWLALEQRIMTPSIVVRRAVYEHLGGFDHRLVCSEDWEMWVRIAAHYPIWYEPSPLALYRMHDASNTGRHLRSAEDIRYTREAIRLFTPYLPPGAAGGVARRARRTYALSALRTAHALCQSGELRGSVNQAFEALRLSRAPAVMGGVSRLTLALARAALDRRFDGRAADHGAREPQP